MYFTHNIFGETVIIRQSDTANIPCDPSNKDHQEFLAWVEAGNTPQPWNPEL